MHFKQFTSGVALFAGNSLPNFRSLSTIRIDEFSRDIMEKKLELATFLTFLKNMNNDRVLLW